MHFKKDELTLIYNSENSKDRQTLAYAGTISRKINKQEINTCRISDTLFSFLLEKLGACGKEVINRGHQKYKEQYRGCDLEASEWLVMLKTHPELLESPIAIYRDKAVICKTPTDVLKVL